MNTFNTMVVRARRGDADAFINLIEDCKMTLRRVALGYLRNDEDVADVMQDTILVQHCTNNSEYSTCYLRQYRVVVSQQCHRIASFQFST